MNGRTRHEAEQEVTFSFLFLCSCWVVIMLRVHVLLRGGRVNVATINSLRFLSSFSALKKQLKADKKLKEKAEKQAAAIATVSQQVT